MYIFIDTIVFTHAGEFLISTFGHGLAQHTPRGLIVNSKLRQWIKGHGTTYANGHLQHVISPNEIMRIQQARCKFLWKGRKEGKPFSWVKWIRIATPKKWGGWGLKQLPAFAQALDAKQGWLLLKQKAYGWR